MPGTMQSQDCAERRWEFQAGHAETAIDPFSQDGYRAEVPRADGTVWVVNEAADLDSFVTKLEATARRATGAD